MSQKDCTKIHFPLNTILNRIPDAVANVEGSADHSCLTGIVKFYQTRIGVLVYSEINGLPDVIQNRIFGFHIHEGTACSGDKEDPFSDALSHYDPEDAPHPEHAGDLVPLFSCKGFALSLFLTDRFHVGEIIGRAIIIHNKPDDFTTQPSGNAGAKIACGIINTTAIF